MYSNVGQHCPLIDNTSCALFILNASLKTEGDGHDATVKSKTSNVFSTWSGRRFIRLVWNESAFFSRREEPKQRKGCHHSRGTFGASASNLQRVSFGGEFIPPFFNLICQWRHSIANYRCWNSWILRKDSKQKFCPNPTLPSNYLYRRTLVRLKELRSPSQMTKKQ